MTQYRTLKLWASPSYIVDWLNGPGHPEATARFVDIIETTQKMAALNAEPEKPGPFDSKQRRRIAAWERHVDELLSQCHPAHLVVYGLKVWHVSKRGAQPPMPQSVYFRWMFDGMQTDAEWDEWNAVESLRKLSEQGSIGRIRRCALESCQVWFYADSALKKFCSHKCKTKKERSTLASKKYANNYAYWHYHFVRRRKPGVKYITWQQWQKLSKKEIQDVKRKRRTL
jgi:hypothetical protein